VSFTAVDAVDPTQTMKVVYNKIVPDTFKDDAQVVVTGTYSNGVFSASEMLAKCPSKYSSTADSN
jgi:cytochrome c-type biogenesis protein CcmE